jgi:hypothetical protein
MRNYLNAVASGERVCSQLESSPGEARRNPEAIDTLCRISLRSIRAASDSGYPVYRHPIPGATCFKIASITWAL